MLLFKYIVALFSITVVSLVQNLTMTLFILPKTYCTQHSSFRDAKWACTMRNNYYY